MTNKNTYEPETLGEEFAVLVGHLQALESFMNATEFDIIDKKEVAAILGISYIPKEKK